MVCCLLYDDFKDLATLSLRRGFRCNVDLERQADGSFEDSLGNVVNNITWGMNNPRGYSIVVLQSKPIVFTDTTPTDDSTLVYETLCVET